VTPGEEVTGKMFAFLGKTGSGWQRVKPEIASRGVARKTLPATFQTANRAETRARVTLPTYGKTYSLFSELLVGRADCPFI
jgi:hypothetical protein